MMLRFLSAFLLPLRSVRILARERMLALALVPALISLMLAMVLLVLAFSWGDDLRDALLNQPGWADSGWLGQLGYGALGVLARLLLAGLAVLLCLMIGPGLAAPFLDRISEKTEQSIKGSAPAPRNPGEFFRSLFFGLRDALSILFWTLAGNIILLFLNLLGPAGSLMYGIAALLFGAFMLTLEYTGMTGNRHFLPFRKRLSLLLGDLPGALGLGLGIYLLFFIPFINLFLLSFGAAGASRYLLDLMEGPIDPRGRLNYSGADEA